MLLLWIQIHSLFGFFVTYNKMLLNHGTLGQKQKSNLKINVYLIVIRTNCRMLLCNATKFGCQSR